MDTEDIDEYFTPTGDEHRKRRELAALGPQVVIPAIARACAFLAYFGQHLEDRNPQLAQNSRQGIPVCFERVTDLIFEVLRLGGPTAGEKVGRALATAISHSPDSNVRALAAACCTLEGVDASTVRDALYNRFKNDSDVLVKAAAAAAIRSIPGLTASRSADVDDFLEDFANTHLPAQVHTARQAFGEYAQERTYFTKAELAQLQRIAMKHRLAGESAEAIIGNLATQIAVRS